MIWILRLILAALILIFAQALLFKKASLHSVTCKRWFSDRYVFAGDKTWLMEQIFNNKPLPVPLLVVESRISRNIELSSAVELDVNDSNYHKSLFTLLPFTKILRRHPVRILKRGYYNLRSIAVTSHDLLGINRVNREIPVDARITAYPAFLDAEDLSLPSHSFLGDAIVRRWIVSDPFLISGVRDYQLQDPMKTINWKASARTGRLQVNQYDYSANTRLLVVMNVDMSEEQWNVAVEEEQLEYTLSLCATLMKYAIENSMEVAFSSNGRCIADEVMEAEVGFGSGEQHLYILLEALALMDFRRVRSFRQHLGEFDKAGIHDTDILIITHYLSQEIETQAQLLRSRGNAVEIMILHGGQAA